MQQSNQSPGLPYGQRRCFSARPQLGSRKSRKTNRTSRTSSRRSWSSLVAGLKAAPRPSPWFPVDVLTAEDFLQQGDTDVSNLLRTLAPSYNVNTQPISDASTIVRPANLRNLAPDHTLVLVNGKRRHRAAVIHWLGGGVADGAQGPDLSGSQPSPSGR